MNRRTACSVLAAGFASATLISPVWAADPKPISISVKDMHCAQCAKKISDRLQTVSGVKSVKIDIKAGKATVTAQSAKAPSPKAMWEAVEHAGFKPTRIETASATFNAKPKA